MKSKLLLAAVVTVAAVPGSSEATAAAAAFTASIAPISPALARQMTGVSWHRGCPVPLRDLRVVTATHHGFDGRNHVGRIVVHRDAAPSVLAVLRRLYADGFPIRRMVPIDAYDGSDFRSIEADNTSAFNCRYVDGTTRYSQHAYGRAIDVNPIENPYVTSSGTTSHPASRPYVRRRRPSRDGGRAPRARARLRRDRLGVGRTLARSEGLPALLRDGPHAGAVTRRYRQEAGGGNPTFVIRLRGSLAPGQHDS